MTRVLVAALASGIAAACLVLAIWPPTRRLAPRIAPYAQRARLLMGQPVDASLFHETGATRSDGRVLAPLVQAAAGWLSNIVDAGGDEQIARRLRQAGRRDLRPEQYRLQQLTSAAQGMGLFVVVALVSAPSPATVLLATVTGAMWGAMRWRSGIDKAIERRKETMRAELYSIAQLLAISLRAGTSTVVALRELANRGGGAVGDELHDALDAIDHGATQRAALEHLATETPEPAASRLYRLLATTDQGTGDILADALLKMADDLRSQRREGIERLATRRRFQMLVPTVALMAPVMLLLLAAPIPTFIFGD